MAVTAPPLPKTFPRTVVLRGERVTLRKLRLADAPDVYANVKDAAVARWTLHIPHPYPRDGATGFIRKSLRAWGTKSYVFGIVDEKTGRLIGVVGLVGLDRRLRICELGYWLGKRHWNRGVMTEAAGLALRFAFRTLGLHRVSATAFEENPASHRVLEKCGFTHEGTMRQDVFRHGAWHDHRHYGLLREEFLARKR